jgi:hypothetical protein
MKKNSYCKLLVAAAICSLSAICVAEPPPPPSPQIPAVPEPGTILAGAMLLVPLGIGAVRALRKPRQ